MASQTELTPMRLWLPVQDSEEKLAYHLFFDLEGHPYLERAGDPTQQFRIDFDRDNQPCVYRLTNLITEEAEFTAHPIQSRGAQSLHRKAEEQYQEEYLDDDEDMEEGDPDYYYEDHEYTQPEVSEEEELAGFFGNEVAELTDEYFVFSPLAGGAYPFEVRSTGEYQSPCLFETFIYDEEKIVGKTHLVYGMVNFRMGVHLEGHLSFRPIDEPRKEFRLSVTPTQELEVSTL